MALLLNRRLFQAGDRVLVALSGGADSLTLLHLLAQERAALRIELAAVHLHHGMRGEAADADVRRLESWCGEWDVPLHVVRADVPALAVERRISVEEAGRLARYRAFAEVALVTGTNKVATAHTADDQVETLLFRLLRGTGTDGLGGIPERRPLAPDAAGVEVVRPLLGVSRAEVESYLREHGLEPLVDSTNFDLHYQRSHIRYELLPLLSGYSPALKEGLLRLSRQAREEGELLDRLAGEVLERARLRPPAPFPWVRPVLELDAGTLAEAPPALARRALCLALRPLGTEVESALLERLVELASAGSGAWDLPGAPFRVLREAGRLMVAPAGAAPLPDELLLRAPGETPAPGWGCRVRVSSGPPPAELRQPPLQAIVDAAAVSPPLRLRAPRIGDAFHPLNSPGHRLLSRQFNDRKVAQRDRSTWPVLCDADGILWVPGLSVAHRARVTEGTSACWHLSVIPEDPPDVL